MAQVQVKWVQNQQFIGVDSTRHSVVMSGTGPEDGIGMKPSELLLVALGGCTAYDVVNILGKKRQHLTDLQIRVDGEQMPDPPWRFVKIHVHYVVTGYNLNPEAVAQAIQLSEEKYCSVSATVAQFAEITYDYEIIELGNGTEPMQA
ncbi:MAG: OsmC family protein [Anaerolineae bacterium]